MYVLGVRNIKAFKMGELKSFLLKSGVIMLFLLSISEE
jgi:hypothetical protein